MPKLHGYRERTPLNIYDAISPRTLEHVPASKGYEPGQVGFHVEHYKVGAFDQPRHIGDLTLTNLQIPRCWSSDQTLFLRQWYARTNIQFDWPGSPVRRAWEAWTHATAATFVLGGASFVSVSLHDLLRGDKRRPDEPALEALAVQLRSAAGVDQPVALWSVEARAAWIAAARTAYRELGAPHLAIVPLRQNVRVDLRSDARAHRALLEVLPTDVAPQSLVWIHLDGVAVREAC